MINNMGYSTTFRLKDKIDKQFQSNFIFVDTKKCKTLLFALCLYDYQLKQDTLLDVSFSKIYDTLKMALNRYILSLDSKAKKELTLDEKNEIDFYGWEYCDDKNENFAFETIDDYIEFLIDQLFIKVVQFLTDKRDDAFDKKYEEFSEIIDNCESDVTSIVNHNFISFYRNHPELADESDGYNHFYPEENKKKESE